MNKFPARQSIYSEDYTLIDEETIEFTKSIDEFIRVKLAKGYNLLELESELIAAVNATVCEIKLITGIEVRRRNKENK